MSERLGGNVGSFIFIEVEVNLCELSQHNHG